MLYMEHACFYICCSDCVGVYGNLCCVAAVEDRRGLEPWSVEICCTFV